MNRKATLEMITTAILLVTFVLVITFLSVAMFYLNYIAGTAAGKVILGVTVASLYQEDVVVTYLTDEYGNKLTDLIGQVVVLDSGARLVIKGEREIYASGDAEETDNCPSTIATSYDPGSHMTEVTDVEQYLRCHLIPEKMAPFYGKGRYCIFVVYNGGEKGMVFGNESIPGCREGEGLISIAAPPGKYGTLTLKVKNT